MIVSGLMLASCDHVQSVSRDMCVGKRGWRGIWPDRSSCDQESRNQPAVSVAGTRKCAREHAPADGCACMDVQTLTTSTSSSVFLLGFCGLSPVEIVDVVPDFFVIELGRHRWCPSPSPLLLHLFSRQKPPSPKRETHPLQQVGGEPQVFDFLTATYKYGPPAPPQSHSHSSFFSA